MPIDVTARHVFAYSGKQLQLADEHTLAFVSGNALVFTSTVSHSQHFLVRDRPRALVAFDINWRTATIAVTAREPNPDILLYSYPEKKLRGKLQHGAPFEYSVIKFSRCGKRLVSLHAIADTESGDPHSSKAPVPGSSSGSSNNISADPALVPHTSHQCVCVWDAEQLEPVKGCAQGVLTIDAAFVSFDPTNPDQFVIGGDDGMEIWKVYRGKGSSLLRHVHVQGPRGRPSSQQHRANGTGGDLEPVANAAMLDTDEKRGQWVCHAWVKSDRFLAANKAGELVLVDAPSATIVQAIDTSSYPVRSCITGIVYTVESVVVAHDDGHILWLNEKHWDIMQSAALPAPKGSATGASSSTTTTSGASSGNSNICTFHEGPGLVVSMVASPNHSKVYIGTREGSIFELKSMVALDDDEEEESEAPRTSSGVRLAVSDGHAANDHLVVPCGSYPVGAVFASSALTPCGGTFANDATVASGGVNGRLYLWSIMKCRLVAEASVAFVFAHSPSAVHDSVPLSSAGGSTSQISASSSGDSLPSVGSLEDGASATSVIVTALASRVTDPVLIVGDHTGRLRAICVSKIVGGSGTVELIPLHSLQLLGGGNPLDILEMHTTQAVVLAASTRGNAVFLLSMDHEKHFQVIAYFTLLEPNEHVVDVKWSVPTHNASALIVTCFSSRGLFYVARYQQTATTATSSSSDAGNIGEAPQRLAPKVVAFGEDMLSKCASITFLSNAPMSMMLAIAPQGNHLHVMKYKDMVLDPTEKLSVLSKVLMQDAHENGVATMALYPRTLADGSEMVATAGMNGAITVWVVAFGAGASSSSSTSTPVSSVAMAGNEWQLEDIQAAKKKTIVVHSGPLTSLMFVDIEDDLYLVSTGSDGCVFLLDVRVPADMKPLRSSSEEPLSMNPLYINIVMFAKYNDAFKPAQELDAKPFLQALEEHEEFSARNRFDRLKDQTRAQLNDLEIKLKVMLSDNDKLPETERLPRDEFVVNVEWRDQLVKKNKERADRVRDGILKDLAKMSIVRERMKLEFWDSATVPGVRLRGLSASPSMLQQGNGSGSNPTNGNLFVYNFPMRRQSKQELLLTKKIELLRTIEFAHQQQEQEEQAAMTMTATAIPQKETAWRRFRDVVLAPNVQWLIDAGIHHPSLNKWLLDKGIGSGGAALTKDRDKNAEMPVLPLPASVNELQSYHLVYHPAAIRTRKQQRIQICLLKSFVRFLVMAFNDEFNALVTLKAAKLDEIDAKNARIVEICTDLGLPTVAQDLYRPQWSPDEIAASILDVKPEEMTQPKYETEAMRRQREKEAAEKLELERQRQKDDVAGRALQDMMDGTLEVKKENLASQSFVKEPWMLEIPLDEMTAEQKKLVAQFEAAQQKFLDEKEKYKKALDLELKKIRSEIQEICKGFDDKLRGLQETYLQMRRSVLVQHLYELRLAEDLLDHEHLGVRRDQIEAAIRELQHAIQKCERENDVFAVQLETCKDEWHRAVEEDKACDKNFLKELDELVGSGAGAAPLEHDLTKHLVELFKKRKGDDIVRDHGDLGLKKSGTKRGKNLGGMSGGSSASLLSGGGAAAAKQWLLTDGLTSDPSARQLSTVTLLQNLQSSSSNNVNDGTDDESNVDPFQYVDFQQQQTPLRRFDSNNSVNAVSQRHVVPLDYDNDRPDGVVIEDRVWRALNTLRTKKILVEHSAKEKAEQYALAKGVADEFRLQLSELHVALQDQHSLSDATARQLDALANSAPLLVHIKQGQDESSHGGLPIEEQELLLMQRGTAMTATRKDDDAFLVARASVESLNDVIQLHGKDQVGILSKIKNFRKNINIMEWEHTLLELQTKDMEERYTDIQLLRVTKDLQELFHTGDTTQKQAREIALLEAKMGHVGTHHASTLLKMDQAAAKLHAQLRDRVHENQRFSEQVQQLQMQVQIREDILTSRKSAAVRHGTPVAGASSKADENPQLKAIIVRRKLVDLAKAQTEEIEYLRMELDKMRRRTFPSFVQYQQHQQPDTKY